MSIKVNTGFLNQSKTPLDTRQVVETLDDLLALDENIIYDGMKCYVHQNDCEYKFNSTYNETDTGHWKLIGSNDGEDLTEYVKQTDSVDQTSGNTITTVETVSGGSDGVDVGRSDGTITTTETDSTGAVVSTDTGDIAYNNGEKEEWCTESDIDASYSSILGGLSWDI